MTALSEVRTEDSKTPIRIGPLAGADSTWSARNISLRFPKNRGRYAEKHYRSTDRPVRDTLASSLAFRA